MRLSAVLLVVFVLFVLRPAAAQTQTPPKAPPPPTRGYLEAFGQSAFGNVTSQAYGGEFGITVATDVQVFAEVGEIKNVATSELGTSADLIAGVLRQVQNATVTFTAKQPVTFGIGGVRYLIPTSIAARPYVLGGFGIARVSNDVTFQFDGADASNAIAQYVTLGSDLSGASTKPMLSLGAGLAWPVWQHLIIDLQYRYGYIFADPSRISTNRVGGGIGVRF
jgi:opacity protein-like surface antigen